MKDHSTDIGCRCPPAPTGTCTSQSTSSCLVQASILVPTGVCDLSLSLERRCRSTRPSHCSARTRIEYGARRVTTYDMYDQERESREQSRTIIVMQKRFCDAMTVSRLTSSCDPPPRKQNSTLSDCAHVLACIFSHTLLSSANAGSTVAKEATDKRWTQQILQSHQQIKIASACT